MGLIQAKCRLRRMIERGEAPLGTFICSLDPAMIDLCGEAGFDFVIIDGEHGRFSRADVEAHVRAAKGAGVIPMVRVLANDATLIQSMLDCGMEGIMVPHIDTADDAVRAVEAVRFAPRGVRGTCAATYFGSYNKADWPQKANAADENIVVIAIIESRQAVSNIERIVAVDGIDVIQFGHADLCADSGYDFTTQLDLIQEDFQKVAKATRAAGKMMVTFDGLGFGGGEMSLAGADYMITLSAFAKLVADHRSARANERGA